MKLHVARVSLMAGLVGGVALAVIGCIGEDAFDMESENVDSVSHAISIGSSLGIPVYTGGTCGLNNGVTPTCTYSNASDMSLVWTAPASRTFTFSTSGSSFDTVLSIAPYNNPNSTLACKDAVRGTAGESVSLALPAGQQIIVTIDGYAALCGNLKLNITQIYLSCTWNGNSYPHGTSITAGATCNKWGSQTCIGGIFPGEPCAGAGECYATCNDGTWIN